MKKLVLAFSVLAVSFSFGQTSITPLDCVEPFYHGVASGDPLDNAVIIWTRVTPTDFGSPVTVSYRVATDTSMMNIVDQGSLSTDASKDFTVKVDVTGLQPDTYYFYEFTALGQNSARGRTKTAPAPGVAVDSVRFAVVSCANLEAGYFNAYEAIQQRNDIEAVLMLGDYIYEYEEGGYAQDASIDRVFDPSHEILTIDDYRLRYSVYHMDQSLQRLHQNYPWICVWDDHESANDSWENGAENHNAGEGNWADRKLAAQQAYFEWLPIRPKGPGNYEIYREFGYGNLIDLFMVDTRLEGREEQGVNQNDPNRTMLGQSQYQWLETELTNSNAQWKILGNQVVMAPITIFGIPINSDAWDGYPAERENLLNQIALQGIQNFTVLTGDIHTSWAFELENGALNVGVEFVTPSVTSPGAPINGGGILTIENPHIKYVELTERGFVILDVNTQRIQADWFYVDEIANVNDSYSWAKSFYSTSGTQQLTETQSVAFPVSTRYGYTMAPECPRPADTTSTNSLEEKYIGVIGLYPNPVTDVMNIHFSGVNEGNHTLTITDVKGRQLFEKEVSTLPMNSTIHPVNVSTLSKGVYLLGIEDQQGNKVTVRFVKD